MSSDRQNSPTEKPLPPSIVRVEDDDGHPHAIACKVCEIECGVEFAGVGNVWPAFIDEHRQCVPDSANTTHPEPVQLNSPKEKHHHRGPMWCRRCGLPCGHSYEHYDLSSCLRAIDKYRSKWPKTARFSTPALARRHIEYLAK